MKDVQVSHSQHMSCILLFIIALVIPACDCGELAESIACNSTGHCDCKDGASGMKCDVCDEYGYIGKHTYARIHKLYEPNIFIGI